MQVCCAPTESNTAMCSPSQFITVTTYNQTDCFTLVILTVYQPPWVGHFFMCSCCDWRVQPMHRFANWTKCLTI